MAGGLSRDPSDADPVETHEINVTPFIDVMLVLLIIFMVAAPLATVEVPVDLPGSSAPPVPRPGAPVYVTLRADLGLAVGDAPVARAELAAALAAATGGQPDTRVLLRADGAVAYADVMALMDDLRAAGFLRVGLVALERARGDREAPPAAVPGGQP